MYCSNKNPKQTLGNGEPEKELQKAKCKTLSICTTQNIFNENVIFAQILVTEKPLGKN